MTERLIVYVTAPVRDMSQIPAVGASGESFDIVISMSRTIVGFRRKAFNERRLMKKTRQEADVVNHPISEFFLLFLCDRKST